MAVNSFGRRIQELRKRKKLSVRELAERTGMDFSRLSKIEHGDRPPPEPEYIVRLAKALEVDAFELVRLAKIYEEILDTLATSPKAQSYFARVERQRKRREKPNDSEESE